MALAETAPSVKAPNPIIENLKRAIFDVLATAHIADVQVEYDTDSDDGKLEAHPFSCADENSEAVACPEIMIQEPLSFAEDEAPRPHELDDAIFGLVYLLLDEDQCVWTGEVRKIIVETFVQAPLSAVLIFLLLLAVKNRFKIK